MTEIEKLIELRDLIDYIPEPMLGYEKKEKLIDLIEEEIMRVAPKIELKQCSCGGRPILWKASLFDGDFFKYSCFSCEFSGKSKRSEYEARILWNNSINSNNNEVDGE